MKGVKSLLLISILIFSSLAISSPIASAEEQEVCCNSVSTEFYLIGSGQEATFSPYEERLSDTSEEVEIANAVNSEEEVASWKVSGIFSGSIPSGDWDFTIPYEIENANGAQVNMTLTIRIGNDEFSASLPGQSSFLSSGEGSLSFSVPIESLSTSEGESIELTLSARSLIFQAPVADSKMILRWGSVDDDASITAQFPFVKMVVPDPVVDQGDVFVSVIIMSPWGMDVLAYSEASITVNGININTESIKTRSGDGVRATWTWSDGEGGEQTITVQPRLDLTDSGPVIQDGSAVFTIYISNPGDGSGTFYPMEEPLRSTGEGSDLDVTVDFSLSKQSSRIILERTVILEIDDEMAYWLRWSLDHIGSDEPSLSQAIRLFEEGSVTDDHRVNQRIDPTEQNEFEQQMNSDLVVPFLNTGLGFDAEDLIGDWSARENAKIRLDLGGNDEVVPAPVTIEIKTTTVVEESYPQDDLPVLLTDFIKNQPVPFWSDYDLTITGKSSRMTSFGTLNPPSNDNFDTRTFRTPNGESFKFSAIGLQQDEIFDIKYEPSDSPTDSAFPLFVLTLLGLVTILALSLRITRGRKKIGVLLSCIALFPLTLLIFFIGMPSEYVGLTLVGVAFLFLVISLLSPRTARLVQGISKIFPMIDCPACGTSNEITSDVRPLRISCKGCQRTMKIVA
ncbi:MAG: hypothetical protein ACPGAN_02165 [Candidatus Poseidoniaceae archaeon]